MVINSRILKKLTSNIFDMQDLISEMSASTLATAASTFSTFANVPGDGLTEAVAAQADSSWVFVT